MDESEQFAASILGITPEEFEDEETSETLTNEEEVSEEEVQNPKEESQTSEDELSDAQQEEESETTETEQEEQKPINASREKRKARAERYARMRAEKQQSQSNDFATNFETDDDGAVTHEQLQELIRNEALTLLEQRELENYQKQIEEDWVDDVEEAITAYPELNPESKEYNKDLDDLLTQAITNPDGTIRYDISVQDMLDKVMSIQKRAALYLQKGNKLKLDRQSDESAITGGIQEEDKSSKRSLEDMSFQDIVQAAEKGLF